MASILLLEINEVPWRVVDRYVKSGKFPALAKFFSASDQFTSVAVDSGELSPWVTWPTVHRGIPNSEHGIRNLGQDPATFGGSPIWDDVRRMGGDVGVFGSMQSWPARDPGMNGFYVPDTFAHDAKCVPSSLDPIQAFNLGMVSRSARVVDSGLPSIKSVAKVAIALFRHGLSIRTIAMVVYQLLAERFNPSRSRRRPIFQTILFWDVFKSLFKPKSPPMFSSFFTNHVAGVMHRYWADCFPEDFGEGNVKRDPEKAALMDFAMSITDNIVGTAMAWSEQNPDLIVVFASSMGQAAIERSEHQGVELVVGDISKLMSAVGLKSGDYQPLLAMVPQVALNIDDTELRGLVASRLTSARIGGIQGLINVEVIGKSLSVTVKTPARIEACSGELEVGSSTFSLSDAGIRAQPVDAGTAYHVPQGVFAVYRGRQAGERDTRREEIPADCLKDYLLGLMRDGGGPRMASTPES